MILRRVSAPAGRSGEAIPDAGHSFRHDSYVGQISVGRIFHGEIRKGEPISLIKNDGSIKTGRVTKILKYKGLARVEVEYAQAGDIVSLAGG